MSSKVIFIPGIKGSELWDNEQKVWFPQSAKDMEDLHPGNKLEAKYVLNMVNAFGVKRVNVYKGILDNFSPELISFYPYDWRQDIQLQINGLIEKIKENVELASDNSVVLVAHSMGGMLAKLAILKLQSDGLDRLVSKLITIGTPWLGSTDAFKALLYGEPGIFEGQNLDTYFQFLKTSIARKLARLCPSVYQLLPNSEYFKRFKDKVLLNSNSKYLSYSQAIDLAQEIFDNAEGNINAINIRSNYILPITNAMLSGLPSHIEHECLIGCDIPTLGTLPIDTLLSKAYFKLESTFVNGDGVVPVFSADPPHNANKYYVHGRHSTLCSIPDVIDFIKWVLKGKKDKIPFGINYIPNNQSIGIQLRNAIVAKVKCPVETTILDKNGRYISGLFDSSIEEVSPLVSTDSVNFYEIGNSKYMFLDEKINTEEISIEIESFDTGVVDISLEEYEEGEIRELSFDPIPVTNKSRISLKLPEGKNFDETIVKHDNKIKKPKLKKFKSEEQIENNIIPEIRYSLVPIEGSRQAKHKKNVFSGNVQLVITNKEQFEQIFYSINKGEPIEYTEYKNKNILVFDTGEYTLDLFGKDTNNRPTKIITETFIINKDKPITKIKLDINPETISTIFEVLTPGPKCDTYFSIISDKGETILNTTKVKNGNKISIPRDYLLLSPNNKITLVFYSENEFSAKEDHRQISFGLGNVDILMWSDNTSYLTPSMVLNNILDASFINTDFFRVKLLKKQPIECGLNDEVTDDVKSVLFESNLFDVQIHFTESYSLYFNGPPTEVIEVGGEYKFSFQLLTEKTKERVVYTSPRVRLTPIRGGKLGSMPINTEEKEGIYYGQFTVDESFLNYRYKLVFTDTKHKKPALREIPLIMPNQG